MPVTESERQQLFNWFEEHMGPERAATMMNLLRPVASSDVAANSRFEPRFDTIDHRFDAIDRKLESLEHRLDAKLERLRSELLRTLGTWLLLSQAAVITFICVVIAVVALD
jgi:hypothetical protein